MAKSNDKLIFKLIKTSSVWDVNYGVIVEDLDHYCHML